MKKNNMIPLNVLMLKLLEDEREDIDVSITEQAKNSKIIKYANIIKEFSNDDLENTYILDNNNHNHYTPYNILDIILRKNHFFLFATLIKKGAFINQIFEISQFYLQENTNPHLDNYQTLFLIESNGSTGQRYFNQFFIRSHGLINRDNSFNVNADDFMSKVFIKYGKKYINDIYRIFEDNLSQFHYESYIPIVKLLDRQFPELNVTKPAFMNEFIHDIFKKYKLLYLKYHISNIKGFLGAGLKFDEENLIVNGHTLLTELLISDDKNGQNIIIPYLGYFEAIGITEKEQLELIEAAKGEKFYDDLKIKYDYFLMNKNIPLTSKQLKTNEQLKNNAAKKIKV